MSQYNLFYKVDELPLAVQRDLEAYPMADAEGAYQVGCVTNGLHPKPLSRLIFAAVAADDSECYVHFESGGFAHTYSARHYQLSAGAKKATLVESTFVPEGCTSVDALKAMLASVRDA